ncbi:MAG: hypothetical protein JKY15_01895 [Deltaproteobacteria bacterium]|nr:hypothetical protein [Deltaproteobacteria bacterium]
MPPAVSLTVNVQVKRTPLMNERDYPHGAERVCCFCEQRFLPGHTLWKETWEHLDNDGKNHALWNLAKVHWKCNEDKNKDFDLQILARELIKKNQAWEETFDFESLRARERTNDTQEHKEIDLNRAHYEITENFLTEKITEKKPRYLLSDGVSCIVLRCKKKTGSGSTQSVRNYLNVLSCTEGKYEIDKIEGKNYIFERTKK